jgi:hypothetical protein
MRGFVHARRISNKRGVFVCRTDPSLDMALIGTDHEDQDADTFAEWGIDALKCKSRIPTRDLY